MAIADAGTPYSSTGTNSSGAQSVTDVVIPSGVSIALIHFNFFYSGGETITSVTLDGQTATLINEIRNTSNNMCADFWCTGMAAGSGKTLAWTAGAGNELPTALGLEIGFLSGTDTSTPIRDSAANNTSGATVSFTSGDWTVIGYGSDSTASPTNGGANTALVAEASGSGSYAGMYYKTDNGTIALGGGTFRGVVVYTVKAAAAGGSPVTPSSNDAVTVAESVAMKLDLQNLTVNDAPTVSESVTMHMPISLKMEKLS